MADGATRHLTPVQVEAEILRLSQYLEEQTHTYADLATKAGTDEATYKALAAKMRLAAMMTPMPDGRKATATWAADVADANDDVAQAYLDRRISEAEADACREAMRTTRTQLDALRTIAANQRGLAG